MQLEELQRQWLQLDEKLERVMMLDGELLRLAVTRPARGRLSRLGLFLALDIAFCLIVTLFAGSILGSHWKTWTLVGPAGVVMTAAILLLVHNIRQLARISEIDWSDTVVVIQSSLVQLRLARIYQFKWIILLSPLVGFCGLVIGWQWLLDRLPEPQVIFDKLDPSWAVCNLVFGVLFIPFGHGVANFLAQRFRGQGWWQRALADISGSNLKRASEELDRWAALDRNDHSSVI